MVRATVVFEADLFESLSLRTVKLLRKERATLAGVSMRVQFTPARTTLIGTAILMACACGTGANSAKLLNMCGIAATPKMTHPLILSVGAVLILRGLWQIRRRAAWLAAISFVGLAAAAAITPPSIMSAAYHTPEATLKSLMIKCRETLRLIRVCSCGQAKHSTSIGRLPSLNASTAVLPM